MKYAVYNAISTFVKAIEPSFLEHFIIEVFLKLLWRFAALLIHLMLFKMTPIIGKMFQSLSSHQH